MSTIPLASNLNNDDKKILQPLERKFEEELGPILDNVKQAIRDTIAKHKEEYIKLYEKYQYLHDIQMSRLSLSVASIVKKDDSLDTFSYKTPSDDLLEKTVLRLITEENTQKRLRS
jgi:hypothetical protein